MNLVRWNNFDRRFPSVSDIFDDFFRSPSNTLNEQSYPSINVKENDEEYNIEIGIPGIKKEDCNINIDAGQLTVSATSKSSHEDDGKNYSRREYNYQSFSRSFTLPNNVNEDRITAKHENGELSINIPKTGEEKEKTKKIEIN